MVLLVIELEAIVYIYIYIYIIIFILFAGLIITSVVFGTEFLVIVFFCFCGSHSIFAALSDNKIAMSRLLFLNLYAILIKIYA